MKKDVHGAASSIETPDATLIRAVLDGDGEAFGILMGKHRAAISSMVFRHVRHREETEDVVQEVFFQAFQNLGRFRGESKFSTWIYSIALNRIRNHVRRRNVRRMDSIDDPGEGEDGRSPQWPDKSPPLDEAAHHRGELERVQEALLGLKEVYRAIFTLHYFQHFSLKDVGQRVGRPVGTVKVYLHRARKMLLGRLQGRAEESEALK